MTAYIVYLQPDIPGILELLSGGLVHLGTSVHSLICMCSHMYRPVNTPVDFESERLAGR